MAEAADDHDAAPSVDPETMSSYINLLTSQAEELGSLLENVNSTLCALRLGWAGSTADEARRLDDDWADVMTRLYGARLSPQDGVVNVIVGGLVEVADDYGQTAQQLQELWQRFYDHLQRAARLSSSRLPTSVLTSNSAPADVEKPEAEKPDVEERTV